MDKRVSYEFSFKNQGQKLSCNRIPKTTLFCLISVGNHSELRVCITFSQQHRFLPTKTYHILSVCILTNGIWVKIGALSKLL